jgi:predicted transposase YdaD
MHDYDTILNTIKGEAKIMPITADIMDNDIIGPAIRQGLQQGRQEGRQEGELTILRRLMIKRFGPLPPWADDRLTALSTTELEELSLRLLNSHTIEELFAL